MTDQTITDRRRNEPGAPPAQDELKARHRAMWALGDYPSVASRIIADLGERVVAATGVGPGDRVLDVAAGSGNASLPAARAGADVVASDLTPELLATGRAEADAQGLDLAWEVGDAEALPFGDGEFDVALSCVGVMFAPFHERAAGELLRVLRPGGRLGLVAWTPEGFIGQMFAAMKPYAPAPPPGATPAPRWGDEGHVLGLLGDGVEDVGTQREQLVVDAFSTGAQFRDFFKERYGPTIAVYRALAGQPDRVEALDTALADLGDRHLGDNGTMHWEYLLLTARRRGGTGGARAGTPEA
ncbi:class I SAM-dependent methyltransferase [Nocardioides solisilvae]|uniref:class I SAM-dependent methyltransferase n=1 Tax=Nocardioides solisilvae TaxID=1542435 RepID=UPI000D74F1BB|nr:class I SAM-dependent methyltransferase [Nocardioides solisilvae]